MREVRHAGRAVNDRYTHPLEAHLALSEQTAALVRKARTEGRGSVVHESRTAVPFCSFQGRAPGRAVGHVIGADVSEEVLTVARQRVKDSGLENVTFIRAGSLLSRWTDSSTPSSDG